MWPQKLILRSYGRVIAILCLKVSHMTSKFNEVRLFSSSLKNGENNVASKVDLTVIWLSCSHFIYSEVFMFINQEPQSHCGYKSVQLPPNQI